MTSDERWLREFVVHLDTLPDTLAAAPRFRLAVVLVAYGLDLADRRHRRSIVRAAIQELEESLLE